MWSTRISNQVTSRESAAECDSSIFDAQIPVDVITFPERRTPLVPQMLELDPGIASASVNSLATTYFRIYPVWISGRKVIMQAFVV
jgi:hypothetical protein